MEWKSGIKVNRAVREKYTNGKIKQMRSARNVMLSLTNQHEDWITKGTPLVGEGEGKEHNHFC